MYLKSFPFTIVLICFNFFFNKDTIITNVWGVKENEDENEDL